jgi:hypothetical protein
MSNKTKPFDKKTTKSKFNKAIGMVAKNGHLLDADALDTVTMYSLGEVVRLSLVRDPEFYPKFVAVIGATESFIQNCMALPPASPALHLDHPLIQEAEKKCPRHLQSTRRNLCLIAWMNKFSEVWRRAESEGLTEYYNITTVYDAFSTAPHTRAFLTELTGYLIPVNQNIPLTTPTLGKELAFVRPSRKTPRSKNLLYREIHPRPRAKEL